MLRRRSCLRWLSPFLPVAALLACDETPEPASSTRAPVSPPALSALGFARRTAAPRGYQIEGAPAASTSAAFTPPATAHAARAVTEIREGRLSLAGAAPNTSRLAFGRGFLVQCGENAITLRGSTDATVLARVSASSCRQALAIPGGSVLVAALDASYRFDPGHEEPTRTTRISFLPDAELHARRDSFEYVWVLQRASRNLLLYSLAPDAGIGLLTERVLEGYDGTAFTTLLDGSLLFSSGASWTHRTPAGRPRALARPAALATTWRLFAASRIDQALAVSRDGTISWVEAHARLRVVRALHTGLLPFDVAATPSAIAVVSVHEQPTAARQFRLTVYTARGEQRFSVGLPAVSASAADDWVASVAAEKQLALSDDPPRVAVGGPRKLQLFDAESGRLLFDG